MMSQDQSWSTGLKFWESAPPVIRVLANDQPEWPETFRSCLMIKFVEDFDMRYGRRQDRACRRFKHNLVKMEIPGIGGDLLKDFAMSDPTSLKVIIPNSVNAPSNRLASLVAACDCSVCLYGLPCSLCDLIPVCKYLPN